MKFLRAVLGPRYSAAFCFIVVGFFAVAAAQLSRYWIISKTGLYQEGSWYATFHDFRLVHLQVNYFDHGYLRRGLVGTALHAFGIKDLQFAGWLLSIFSILCFVGIIGVIFANLKQKRQHILYIVMAISVLGPSGVSQFIITAGQVDHILLPLLAFSALAGVNGRLWTSLTLFIVMYQIHELTVIAFLPLVLISNIIGSGCISTVYTGGRATSSCWSTLVYFGLVTIALLSITLLYGDSQDAIQLFLGTNDARSHYGEMVWGKNSPLHPVSWRGIPSLILIFYYFLLICFGSIYCMTIPRSLFLLPAAALSCLLLNFVGVDAGRWAAIGTWTLLVSILATEVAISRTSLNTQTSKSMVFLGLLLAVPIGPLGSTDPFTFSLKLLEIVN